MALEIGSDISSFLQTNIFLAFDRPKSVAEKKTIEQVFEERGIKDTTLLNKARSEADRMVHLRLLYYGSDKIYVFSKDNEKRYFWRPSNFVDRTVNSVLLSLSESKKDYVLSLLFN